MNEKFRLYRVEKSYNFLYGYIFELKIVTSPNYLETKFIYRSSNILYGVICGAETAYYSGTPTLLFRNTNVQPRVVLCPPLFLMFYLAIICSVRLRILASDYPFGTFKWFPHRKRCSVRHYLHLFVGGLMSYLRYLCFLVCFCIQHILCCGFLFCSSYVLCTQCCQFLWIFHSWMHLRFSITFIL